ncbi:MAG: hypothetical protein IKS28_03105 [Clostridia bacterium]|nr:hypothetical protein [Clostridia bacterium]
MKNLLCKIVSLLVVMSAVFAAVSCSGNVDSPGVSSQDSGNAPVTASLPDTKFDGEKVSFLVRGQGNEWDCIDVFQPDTTDRVSDAILNRNMKVEEQYGVEIEQTLISVDLLTEEIRKLAESGDLSYDVYVNSLYGLYTPAVEGSLLDMNSLPYNDFTQEWWDAELNGNLTLAGHRFFAVSSMNLMSYYATWVVTYNMGIFEDLGYDVNEPYQLVRDGAWTIDKYTAYQKDFTRDINDDGKMTDQDQWGTAGQSDHILGMLYGVGFSVLQKDSDDLPQLQIPSNSIYEAMSKVMAICVKGNAFDSHDASVNLQYSTDGEYGRRMFADNRAMFFHETLKAVSTLRDMNGEFGVIPVPKYSENQKNYISMVHYWATSMNAVPSWGRSAEKVSAILEAMAYYSEKTVVPEFLSSAVYGKYLRDDASYEMMNEYIRANRFIDFGIVSQIGGIIGVVKSGIYDGSLNYSRIIDSVKKGVAEELENLADQLR